MKEITKRMLRDTGSWPQVTHLCMKHGEPIVTGRGKCGIVLRSECGAVSPRIIVRSYPDPLSEEMYGGPFVEKFDSIDALLDAGWIVD
jgi:hypothetical protein